MTVAEWFSRVERRECRVGIVGMGYVGLPLALEFSQAGFGVTGFDVDPEKVDRLRAGESYIYRVEAAAIQAALVQGGGREFRATGDFAEIRQVDAVLICVPTPLDEEHRPDLSYVRKTMESIAPYLRAGQMVVLESTTYPGTTEEIVVETIERVGRIKVGREVKANHREHGGEERTQGEVKANHREHGGEERTQGEVKANHREHGGEERTQGEVKANHREHGGEERTQGEVRANYREHGEEERTRGEVKANHREHGGEERTQGEREARANCREHGGEERTRVEREARANDGEHGGEERTQGEVEELRGVLVAFSPEREDPGNTETPRRTIPKVVGGVDRRATEVACALYGAVFERTVAMSSPAAAEMTKLLENIYRNVNIALVNEMKQLCLHMGIDIWEVIDAAKTKPFGFQAFYPGPGVGGHCIPVDPFYLSWKAEQMGFAARFIALAGEVNESMPRYVVDTVERQLRVAGCELEGSAVLVLGVAYKRDVDDLRESPALVVIEMLRQNGAHVAYNDPYFPVVGKGRRYDLQMRSTPLDEVGRFDCVAILTDHSSYDYAAIVADAKLVVDTRNATRGIVSAKIHRC